MNEHAQMEAVVVTDDAPARMALGKVPAPVPSPSEAVVRVAAVSLNPYDVRHAQSDPPGTLIGEDLAGTVVQAAANGSGPKAGTRVIGYLEAGGAWAELAAVPTATLGAVPDGVAMTEAATLPCAGLVAMYAVDYGGALLGRRVLVTGASGGIGHLAVQLAHLAGGRVVAQMRNQERVVAVPQDRVETIVIGDDAGDHGPYHLIVDVVGGDTLARALGWLEPDGVAVCCGVSSGQVELTLDLAHFRDGSLHRQHLHHEFDRRPASVMLETLGRLLGDGLLTPHVAIEAPWSEVGDVAQRLSDRAYAGKAVLTVE